MKVTVYTTPDCAFSKQEKEYLAAKGVIFEEKDVHLNRDFLTEMLSVSNNFAGTPVTKIDQDDGNSVVLKGFTQQDFDNILNINMQTVNSTIPKPPTDQSSDTQQPPPIQPEPEEKPVEPPPVQEPQPEPVPVEPPQPIVETPPPPVETPPIETPIKEPQTETPPAPQTPPEQTESKPTAKQDEALSSILDSLKTKSEEPTTQNPSMSTSIPNFQG